MQLLRMVNQPWILSVGIKGFPNLPIQKKKFHLISEQRYTFSAINAQNFSQSKNSDTKVFLFKFIAVR